MTRFQKIIELLERQIVLGEKMPYYGIYDDDANYSQWRTTCEGILARIHDSWVHRFYSARYSEDGSRAQVAQLRAFIDLLKIEGDEPAPEPAPKPRVVPPAQTIITNNFHGDHGRAYVGSEDNSTNTTSMHVQVWAEIDKVIEKAPESVRAELAGKAQAARVAQGTKSYRERWDEFMGKAATYCTVLGTLWPILAALLQQVSP